MNTKFKINSGEHLKEQRRTYMQNLLNKNLEIIKRELNNNDPFEVENGCNSYDLFLHKSNNSIVLIPNECSEEMLMINTEEIRKPDIKSIIKLIIGHIYEAEINYRQNYVNKTNGFLNRKAKSLVLWKDRNKQDKVDKIIEEIIERQKNKERLKNEVDYYKGIVGDLYSCLNVLDENWKLEDIRDYIEEEIKQEVDIEDNKLIVGDIKINVDNYSNKNVILNSLRLVM